MYDNLDPNIIALVVLLLFFIGMIAASAYGLIMLELQERKRKKMMKYAQKDVEEAVKTFGGTTFDR